MVLELAPAVEVTAGADVTEIVRAELKHTRKQFGQPRRTVIPTSEAVFTNPAVPVFPATEAKK